jgi:protocatechuate 3,4-dioxygenase beta subunit
MKVNPFAVFLVVLTITGCAETDTNAQSQSSVKGERVGGRCEGCEGIYENKTPFEKLDWQLTLPDYNDKGPKLHITGTVYKSDSKTPSAGTILYFYHTDQAGIYPPKNETGWGRRHGYIRGWLKTNDKGQYSIRTLRPAPYPGGQAAAHIHCIVKENNLNEYYIGDFLFDDDPLISKEDKSKTDVPGGNGVLKPQEKNGVLYAERNIYLGKHVRNYPLSVRQQSDFILSGIATCVLFPTIDDLKKPGKRSNYCKVLGILSPNIRLPMRTSVLPSSNAIL